MNDDIEKSTKSKLDLLNENHIALLDGLKQWDHLSAEDRIALLESALRVSYSMIRAAINQANSLEKIRATLIQGFPANPPTDS